jgi:CDP-diacylglycerol--serine O-phosphatidyltransferase
MNNLMKAPQRLAKRMLPFRQKGVAQALLDALPFFAIPADAIEVLPDPAAFRQALLQAIAQATRRIVIVTLYLQDDDGGREVLDALYAARRRIPRCRFRCSSTGIARSAG